ncbi:MAG: DNA internalization-related competence protein ComEC/Rec2 [Pseudohongiellaceae bacterium]
MSGVLVREPIADFELSLVIAAVLWLCLALAKAFSCHHALQRLLLYGFLFLLGMVWHLHWASARLGERLPVELEKETLSVVGLVLGLPEQTEIAQQFQFYILSTDSGFYPRKVALNYYGDQTITPGQRWRFAVRLNRPHGFANPGGFDYEAWLFQRGISARGYVRASADNRLLGYSRGWESFSSVVWLHSLRYQLKDRLNRLAAGGQYSGLLLALVLGDRSAISQDSWNLFSATGSNHLFVISGLHIGLISGFSYFISLLFARVFRVGRIMPAQKLAAFVALVAAFFYALLAGFTLPTQRAFIMIAVFIGGVFCNASYLVSFRLLLALLIVLLLNPLAIVSSGFWLSFVAVAALVAFSSIAVPSRHLEPSVRDRLRAIFNRFIKPQFIVLLALAIPLIFFTQQLSLLSPVVNIVAIPVVGFLIVPLCFIALLLSFLYEPIAMTLLEIAHGGLLILLNFMQVLVAWGADTVQLHVSRPSGWQLPVLILAVLIILLPKAICHRRLLLPLLLPLLPLPANMRAAPELEDFLRLHIVDVGQGLAVVVQTRAHTLLYDSGANLSPDFNIGSAVIVPVLRALDVEKLDAVVISHGDNDHAGGLRGIQPTMEIDRLISNHSRINGRTPAQLCASSDGWNWDGVAFRFLQTGLEFADENNNSCVLQLSFGDERILLPGDIEREAELELALKYGDGLRSTVLLAPHHGSLSSSSYGLLKRVRPRFVVFSSGYRNSFGHPHERVLARYGEFGTTALNTATTGMISFDFAAGQAIVSPALFREQNLRYWH